jgi:hypothetical protein
MENVRQSLCVNDMIRCDERRYFHPVRELGIKQGRHLQVLVIRNSRFLPPGNYQGAITFADEVNCTNVPNGIWDVVQCCGFTMNLTGYLREASVKCTAVPPSLSTV